MSEKKATLCRDGKTRNLPTRIYSNRLAKEGETRYDVLERTLAEKDDKVVIWCMTQREVHNVYRRLCTLYGEDAVHHISRAWSFGSKIDKLSQFNDGDSNVRFLITTPYVMGSGVEIDAERVIFFTEPLDPRTKEQTECRTYRFKATEMMELEIINLI